MNDSLEAVMQLKDELLTSIRQEFYLVEGVRDDYLVSLLRKAAILMQSNFGIEFNGSSSQKIILQDLVRHFYKGGNDKDAPAYLRRMINQEKLKGGRDGTEGEAKD